MDMVGNPYPVIHCFDILLKAAVQLFALKYDSCQLHNIPAHVR
jgi:hypothetical protein